MADGVRGQRGAFVVTGAAGTQLSEQVVGRRDACEHQQRRTAHCTCQRDVSVQPIADHASAPAVWKPRAQQMWPGRIGRTALPRPTRTALRLARERSTQPVPWRVAQYRLAVALETAPSTWRRVQGVEAVSGDQVRGEVRRRLAAHRVRRAPSRRGDGSDEAAVAGAPVAGHDVVRVGVGRDVGWSRTGCRVEARRCRRV